MALTSGYSPPFMPLLQELDFSGARLEEPSWDELSVRFLLIQRGQAEDAGAHPEVAPLLQEGWKIGSIQPRVVEGKGSRLLVLLHRPDRSTS